MVNILGLIPGLPLLAAGISALAPRRCRRLSAGLAIGAMALAFLLSGGTVTFGHYLQAVERAWHIRNAFSRYLELKPVPASGLEREVDRLQDRQVRAVWLAVEQSEHDGGDHDHRHRKPQGDLQRRVGVLADRAPGAARAIDLAPPEAALRDGAQLVLQRALAQRRGQLHRQLAGPSEGRASSASSIAGRRADSVG